MVADIRRMKSKFLVFVSMVLVGTVMLFVSTGRLDHVLLQTPLTLTHEDISIAEPYQRYRTSDEMLYILHGQGEEFSQYDPQLIDYIRGHISQPSAARQRKLARPRRSDASQVGQSRFVDRLLSGRRNGFFVECGAADGEEYSNSLFFELEQNWTGLLIEANPDYHRALLKKNRRAYVLGSCLSTDRRPMTVRMPADVFGGITDKMHWSHIAYIGAKNMTRPEIAVNCFPLNSIIEAINVSRVDYMSLDVEGPELDILRTINWKQLHIDVLTVEYRIIKGVERGTHDKPETLKRLKDLREFFRDLGIYREVALLPTGREDSDGLDIVLSRI